MAPSQKIPQTVNYFTSCDPHHDIYTFSHWQIFWHSIWHIFWHSIWHIFRHMFWHIFWHSIWHSTWHISWHFIWHIFWHSIYLAFYLPTWGPAGNTWRGYSRLRSGREHWARMVVVEVRQRTLCVEGRGWAGGGGEERRRGEEERSRQLT